MDDINPVQHVAVVVTCPACGSPDYEEEFDSTELCSMVEVPCEDCGKAIVISVDVTVQAWEGRDD